MTDDLFRLFDAGRPGLFSSDPNVTPQESQANFGPSGWYTDFTWNQSFGQSNFLSDPRFVAFGSASYVTTSTPTAANGRWTIYHTLNSGSMPVTHQFGRWYALGAAANDSPLNSQGVYISVGDVSDWGATDADFYVYPTDTQDQYTVYTTVWNANFLVSAFKVVAIDLASFPADATVRAYAQIYNVTDGTTAAESEVDLTGITENEMRPAYTFLDISSPASDKTYRWRLRINVAKTTASGSGYVSLLFGEPSFHTNFQPTPLPYFPSSPARYTPPEVGRYYATATSSVIRSRSGTDGYDRFTLNSGGIMAWGSGSASTDTRVQRSAAKTIQIDDGAAGAATLSLPGTAPAVLANDVRLVRSGTSTLDLDDGAAGAATLQIASTGTLKWGGAGTLDANNANLRVPVGSGALTTTEGYFGYQSALERVRVYDGQRERSVTSNGWQPYAYPVGGDAFQGASGQSSLPVSGGSIAVPIEVTGHMLLESVSYAETQGAGNYGTTEWRIYEQYLNAGNGAENTLSEVTGANGTATSGSGSGTITSTSSATAYLPPGLYWIVIRCTDASNAFPIDYTSAGKMALNACQTKTLGSALGSTLDFVAATWTKQTYVPLVRLNGRVFGQTAAF